MLRVESLMKINFKLVFKLFNKCAYMKVVNPAPPRGCFTVVPTTLGNLSDISPNMLKALFEADLIACEDRRVAGQLYHLIRNRNLLAETTERFGSIGLSDVILSDQKPPQQEQAHSFYNYANMNDKQRRKFLRKMPIEQQQKFKVQFLKYRATKALKPYNEWTFNNKPDKLDQLYGIELSDMAHIQTQIANCRKKKGRGLLIPLNTYSETKMFDLVRVLLESKKIALVSDAGMPCISDPGWKLIDKIRRTMPLVPIRVIGGPCSVAIMIEQASMCAEGSSLSGRFQGFSNLTTGNFEQNNIELIAVKMKEFSINFINANKLKKRLLYLQRALSGQHQVLLANELTKKYQRRYNGTISDLIPKLDNDDFAPKGEISYLVYPSTQEKKQNNESEQISKKNISFENQKSVAGMTSAVISINKLLESVNRRKLFGNKDKCNLLCAVFGIKQGEARKYVYNQTIKS